MTTIGSVGFKSIAALPAEVDRNLRDIKLCVHDGNAYVLGGFKYHPVDKAYKYNIASKTWYILPDMINPRSDCHVGVLDGKMYLIGGRIKTGA